MVVKRERVIADTSISIVRLLGKIECSQCVVAHGHVEGGTVVACCTKLHVDGHIATCGVVERQLVGLLWIVRIVVCLKECTSCVDEGEGIFFMNGMGIVCRLGGACRGSCFRFAESSRSASGFRQEVVDVLGVRVVAMDVGAAFIWTCPQGGATGIEEQGSVAFAIERNLCEVIVKILNVRLRQERKVVAIETDLGWIAEAHALEVGAGQLIHTFVRHTNLHPLACSQFGMFCIARLGIDANGQYPYQE